MPKVDRGKEFESLFENFCEESGDINCVRFYDATQRFKGVKNPADFVISKGKDTPSVLIECKSTHEKSFGLHFRQREDLEKLKNFRSFVLVWFVEDKQIWGLTLDFIHELEEATGWKSFNPSKFNKIKENFINLPIRLDISFARIKPTGINFDKFFE